MTKHFAITSALQNKGRCNCLVLGGLGNNTQELVFKKNTLAKFLLQEWLLSKMLLMHILF